MVKLNIYDNEWQEFPLMEDKPIVEITDQQYIDLLNGNLTVKNGKIIDNTENKIAEQRIAELKQMLSDTDYKAIKYAEGELPYAEYESTRKQRREWRAEINNLELKLNE